MSDQPKHYAKLEIVGKLLIEPELKQIGTSRHLLKLFVMSTTWGKKDPDTGKFKEYKNPWNFNLWGKTNTPGDVAEEMFQKLNKFDVVKIHARVGYEEWEDKQTGKKRGRHFGSIDEIEIVQPHEERPAQQDSEAADGAEDDIPF